MTKSSVDRSEAIRELVGLYQRNGYVRWPRPERLEREDSQDYKKGVELRFTAYSADEAEHISELLGRVGIQHGRPHAKGPHVRIPVYGEDRVMRFMAMLESWLETLPEQD